MHSGALDALAGDAHVCLTGRRPVEHLGRGPTRTAACTWGYSSRYARASSRGHDVLAGSGQQASVSGPETSPFNTQRGLLDLPSARNISWTSGSNDAPPPRLIDTPSVTLEQLDAQVLLQTLNVLADAGLAHVQPLSCPREVFRFCCGDKNAQAV